MATIRYCICSNADYGTPNWGGQASEVARDAYFDGANYTTVTAWEAATYGATAADDAIGEIYGTITEDWNLTDNTPLSIILQPASGEGHDGTIGSGAGFIVSSVGYTVNVGARNSTVHSLEFDGDGKDPQTMIAIVNASSGITASFHHNIVHNVDLARGSAVNFILLGSGRAKNFSNNLITDVTNSLGGEVRVVSFASNSADGYFHNNTITNISTAGDVIGIYNFADDAQHHIKNNLVSALSSSGGTTACYGGAGWSNVDNATNGGDDATSPDGASYQGLTVTFTGGSPYDFMPAADATVIGGGTDLGTTPPEIEIDLTGYDRTAAANWSLGAVQYVAGGSTTTTTLAPTTTTTTTSTTSTTSTTTTTTSTTTTTVPGSTTTTTTVPTTTTTSTTSTSTTTTTTTSTTTTTTPGATTTTVPTTTTTLPAGTQYILIFQSP